MIPSITRDSANEVLAEKPAFSKLRAPDAYATNAGHSKADVSYRNRGTATATSLALAKNKIIASVMIMFKFDRVTTANQVW